MSIVSGTIAALGQRKSAKEQNRITQQQNADQLALELAARGAPIYGTNVPEEIQGTESAILPYYFGNTEKEISTDARELYKALTERLGPASVRVANYDALLGRYDKSSEANDKLAEDLALGNLTEEAIAESQPVFEARKGVADAKRNAGLEALAKTLNEISAIQAGKGYSGDSTGSRMLRFDARRKIGTQAAADLANVKLENANDVRAIRQAGRDQRLANLDLPSRLAVLATQRKQLPINAVSAEQNALMQPFDFFNIGTGRFSQANPLPAMPNTAGDIANSFAQTGSAIGGSLLKYYTNRDLQDRANRNAAAGFKTNEGDTSGWKYLFGGGAGAPEGTTFDSDYSYAPGVNAWGESYK